MMDWAQGCRCATCMRNAARARQPLPFCARRTVCSDARHARANCSRMEELLEKPAILAFLKDCEVMKGSSPPCSFATAWHSLVLSNAVHATRTSG